MTCIVQWIVQAGELLLLDAEIKMNKFEKDMRVMKDFEKLNIHEDDRQPGVIIADPRVDPITGEEKVYVQWDSTPWRGTNPEEVLTESLISEADGNAKYSQLETEWNVAEAEVKVLINAAAALIDEASEVASKAGCESLTDMYDSIRPLYRAMDNAGWNTSSFGC